MENYSWSAVIVDLIHKSKALKWMFIALLVAWRLPAILHFIARLFG